MLLSTTSDIFDYESSERPPFTHSGAIAKEKASTFCGRLSFPSFRGKIERGDGPDIPLDIFRINRHDTGDCVGDILLVINKASGSA
jgi:hypothetical protein